MYIDALFWIMHPTTKLGALSKRDHNTQPIGYCRLLLLPMMMGVIALDPIDAIWEIMDFDKTPKLPWQIVRTKLKHRRLGG